MDQMTPKERWLAVLTGETPDRVPMDYWATPETTRRLMQYLGCSTIQEMVERLHIDAPINLEPDYTGPPLKPGYDYYGCGMTEADYGTGMFTEYIYHPLTQHDSAEAIDANYTWPSADWQSWPSIIKGSKPRPRLGWRTAGWSAI